MAATSLMAGFAVVSCQFCVTIAINGTFISCLCRYSLIYIPPSKHTYSVNKNRIGSTVTLWPVLPSTYTARLESAHSKLGDLNPLYLHSNVNDSYYCALYVREKINRFKSTQIKPTVSVTGIPGNKEPSICHICKNELILIWDVF